MEKDAQRFRGPRGHEHNGAALQGDVECRGEFPARRPCDPANPQAPCDTAKRDRDERCECHECRFRAAVYSAKYRATAVARHCVVLAPKVVAPGSDGWWGLWAPWSSAARLFPRRAMTR